MSTIPTIDQIKALDDRDFAMLTTEEVAVLDFYRTQGRKYDVAVVIIHRADPSELARAPWRMQADAIMKRAGGRVTVHVGSGAHAAWVERHSADLH